MNFTFNSNLISLKRDVSWLEKPPKNQGCLYGGCVSPRVKILSGDGFSVSLPAPLLIASSSLLRTIISTSNCCGDVNVSIPSLRGCTLVLLSEMLRRGETKTIVGTEIAAAVDEVQEAMDLLQCGVFVTIKKMNKNEVEIINNANGIVDEIREDNLVPERIETPPPQGSRVVSSPNNSCSSSVTLSPRDFQEVEEEEKPDPEQIIYMDVPLSEVIASPMNTFDDTVKAAIEEESEKIENKSVISCPFCQKIMKSMKCLIQHIDLRHPEPIHGCAKCSKSFTSKKKLESHSKTEHVRLPRSSLNLTTKSKVTQHVSKYCGSFQCKLCSEVFPSKGKLLIHIRDIHTRLSGYDCYVKLEKLNIKLDPVGNCKDRRFSCGVCFKIFNSKLSFKKHCRTVEHHPDLLTNFKMVG